MKFIECPELAVYNSKLDGIDIGDSIICGKIETYSCKRAGTDKKLGKVLDQKLQDDAKSWVPFPPESTFLSMPTPYESEPIMSPTSPPSHISPMASSPFGPLSSSASRKTLIDLISLLNASYPDYEFSSLKPEDFVKEANLNMVLNSINLSLGEAFSSDEKAKLWSTVNDIISLSNCDIYAYLPDPDSDPMAEGKIWTFNYFFYNKKLKKVLFFACYAESYFHNRTDGMSEDSSSDYENLPNLKNVNVHFAPREPRPSSPDTTDNDDNRTAGGDGNDSMDYD